MNPIVKLAAAFSPPAIDRMTLQVYIERLSIEKPEHVEYAVNQAIEHCKHLPRIAELLEFVRKRKAEEYEHAREKELRSALQEHVNTNRPRLCDLLNQLKNGNDK